VSRRARVRRRARTTLVLAAVAIVGGVGHANAPPGQYATFDRTDTCISDLWTKLTWQRQPAASPVAFGAVACPTGWRLPSVNELETLVDESPHEELENGQLLPKAIDANAFPSTPVTYPYWTSSVIPGGGQTAWVVNFQDGSTLSAPMSEPQQVRCVIVTPVGSTPAACQP
jgi:hypothetical protein